MLKFENKVFDGLKNCCSLYTPKQLAVAVSGGADSISLLFALAHIIAAQKDDTFFFQPELKVITINHNIREAGETAGDAAFVQDCCKQLVSQGFNVTCTLVEFAPGEVTGEAEKRGQGLEEAARTLRYSAFEKFIKENNVDYLCLAHNKNDQLETLLMRFMSGASLEASCGIKAVREVAAGSNSFYIRPMLDISRDEIEAYLKEQKLSWRTDSTNADTAYFRNKVRLELVPFLREKFPGWENSVLTAAERRELDADFIEGFVNKWWGDGGVEVRWEEVIISAAAFKTLQPAVQYRVLLKACSLAGENQRIPMAFLQDFLQHPDGKKIFHNIEISLKNNSIFVKKYVKNQTEMVFSAIINDVGLYQFPFGTVTVHETAKSGLYDLIFNENTCVSSVELPCCIRNLQPDDEIETADGKLKKVADIYSNWHIPSEQRGFIPIVQKLSGSKQEIICIIGSVCGFNNWIVYEKVNN